MWLALYMSKFVTRPVAALAAATQEISKGNLDYRVAVPAADELGDLVRSFNLMAEELQSSRHQVEASSQQLSAVNVELEQRRRHIETILESIPTGVLSLDASLRVSHLNQALLRLLRPSEDPSGIQSLLVGSSLRELFPADVMEDLDPLLRRAADGVLDPAQSSQRRRHRCHVAAQYAAPRVCAGVRRPVRLVARAKADRMA
jgi:nitrogen fixation/metabolism regulation signal transduction histidine kinase